jgi:hypothetical protein
LVDIRKLTDCCLNFEQEIGKHKARVFESALDLTVENAEELKDALLVAVKTGEAQSGRFDKFGQRYTVDFEMERNEKKATVRSGWIIENDTDFRVLRTVLWYEKFQTF